MIPILAILKMFKCNTIPYLCIFKAYRTDYLIVILCFQAKSWATFGPMGPFIVTKDEIADPHDINVRIRNNDYDFPGYNTKDMAHKIPRIMEWVSSVHTMEPGDVLATGTNHRGLSAFQDGDKIDLEVEGLGTLHFNVQDDLKRTWARDTRLDMANKGQEGTTPQISGKYAK